MKLSSDHYLDVSCYMKLSKGECRSNYKHKINMKICKVKAKLHILAIQRDFLDDLIRFDLSGKKTSEVIVYLKKKWENAKFDHNRALDRITLRETLLKEIEYAEQLSDEEYEALFQQAWKEYEQLRPKCL